MHEKSLPNPNCIVEIEVVSFFLCTFAVFLTGNLYRMKKFILESTLFVATLFAACDNSPKFTIEGKFTNADSTMLYIENISHTNTIVTDSILLTGDGNYKFRLNVPEQAQFYRLRLGEQYINFVIDTACHVTCTGDATRFATDYSIEGSENCRIMREVDLSGRRLKGVINTALKSNDEFLRQVASDSLECYKKRMGELVLQAPASPVAYYILMQRVNGLPVFDTYNKTDNRIIAAAATAHEVYAPTAARTEILRNIALQGIAALRSEQQTLEVDAEKVSEINFVDIDLYDLGGNQRKLSDIASANRVVLLDFTGYALDYSPAYNMQLAEIYNSYKDKGLEIYQVSLDADYNRWQIVADNLPWICVHDADNVYSSLIPLYGIQSLPTCYIIADNGNQFLRPTDIDDLKQKLAQILR